MSSLIPLVFAIRGDIFNSLLFRHMPILKLWFVDFWQLKTTSVIKLKWNRHSNAQKFLKFTIVLSTLMATSKVKLSHLGLGKPKIYCLSATYNCPPLLRNEKHLWWMDYAIERWWIVFYGQNWTSEINEGGMSLKMHFLLLWDRLQKD